MMKHKANIGWHLKQSCNQEEMVNYNSYVWQMKCL